MSAVIKRGVSAGAPVRNPLASELPSGPSQPPESVVSVEVLALRRQVEELNHRLGQRGQEIERLRADITRAYEQGEVVGRKLGRDESDARRADQLAALESGVRTACERFSAELLGLERLAAAISREALVKVVGDPGRHGDLLSHAIRHQLDQLESESVIAVLVSGADFDQPELAELALSLERRGLEFSSSDELEPGECRIKLRLGVLHAGVPQQWERLDRVLTELSVEAAA